MKSAWQVAEALAVPLDALGASASAVVAFKTEGPLLVPSIDRSVADATLQIQPWSEAEEALDRGDMQAGERVINVILQAPLEGLSEQKAMQWLNQVKDEFGELSLTVGTEEWRWRRNETVTLYDTDAASTKHQFLSIFRATFFNYA
jgi:hypothetical protein